MKKLLTTAVMALALTSCGSAYSSDSDRVSCYTGTDGERSCQRIVITNHGNETVVTDVTPARSLDDIPADEISRALDDILAARDD